MNTPMTTPMSEMDDLPESVARAVKYLDSQMQAAPLPHAALSPAYWADVRVELLLLAARVKELEAENGRLRDLCGCAYQAMGVHDAPEKWMDALAGAKNGEPFTTDGLLPYAPDAVCAAESELDALKAKIAASRRISVGMYPAHGSGHVEVICDYGQCPDKEARPYALLDMGEVE